MAKWVVCLNCGKEDVTVPGHTGTKVGMICTDCRPDGQPTCICRKCCPTEHGCVMPKPRTGIECHQCHETVPGVEMFVDDIGGTHEFCQTCANEFLGWLFGSLRAGEIMTELHLWHEQGGPSKIV